MNLVKGVGDFFALDIGTKAVRVVQLSGGAGRWNLVRYGYAPLDAKLTAGDNAESKRRLGEVIMTAVGQSGIKSRNVVVAVPAQKSFTTVIDLPVMPDNELKSTIRYQIDKYIPMSVEGAKVDWVQLGVSAHDPTKQEILLSSTATNYAEEQLEFIEGLGFNVIALEPDALAMARSVTVPGKTAEARVLLDVGELSTNLVIVFNDAPRLVRNIPTGLTTLVKVTSQNLNVQEDQARQFILKFGLAQDKLEGQVLKALNSTLDGFVSEITKSIKFFQTRYPNSAVGGIGVTGYAAIVPQLGEYLAGRTGVRFEFANPWQHVVVQQADQQQLAAVSSEFAVAVGLAERTNKL